MLKRELSIFLIVGLLTVAIDFLIYRGFIYVEPFGLANINLAKGSSFISGAIFAYFANRFWTFKEQTTSAGNVYRFVLVYIFGLIANIGVNHLCLARFTRLEIPLDASLFIAFIVATGVSAALNFIGMKFFVFTDQKLGKS